MKKTGELPSQEEAEKATQEAQAKADEAADETPKKSTWSSYVPSLGLGGGKKTEDKSGEQDGGKKNETEQQKNSRTWGQYFTAGKGFSSYIPKQATDTVSQFASQVNPSIFSVSPYALILDPAPTRHQQILPRTTPRLQQNPRRGRWYER